MELSLSDRCNDPLSEGPITPHFPQRTQSSQFIHRLGMTDGLIYDPIATLDTMAKQETWSGKDLATVARLFTPFNDRPILLHRKRNVAAIVTCRIRHCKASKAKDK